MSKLVGIFLAIVIASPVYAGQEVGSGRNAVNDPVSGRSNASAKNNNGRDSSKDAANSRYNFDTKSFNRDRPDLGGSSKSGHGYSGCACSKK